MKLLRRIYERVHACMKMYELCIGLLVTCTWKVYENTCNGWSSEVCQTAKLFSKLEVYRNKCLFIGVLCFNVF